MQFTKDGTFTGTLEAERRRFLAMVRIVKAADHCLSLHHGATFGCGIANICLLLYCLIYYPALSSIPSVAGAFAFWLVMAVFDMTTVCLSGILVNSAVSTTAYTQ